jgi:O-antigen/teichoic acid export membrane protein
MNARRGSAWLLVIGQVIGQLGMLIALPVITRSYSPHEVGLYQIANAIALIVQPIASWRYEFIIPSAHTEWGARRFARLGNRSVAIVGSAALGLAALAYSFGSQDLAVVAGMVAPLVIAYATLAVDNAVLIRRGHTRRLASRNFLSGMLGGGFQIVVAATSLPLFLLAVAVLLARVTAILVTRTPWRPTDVDSAPEITYTPSRALPTVLSGVVSNAAVNALPLVVPATGSTAGAGYAGTAQRIAAAPASFIGQALGQIVQTNVAPLVRSRQPRVKSAVLAFIRKASVPVLGVAIALAIGGPLLAEPVLGPGWQPAGVMLAMLALPYSLQLLVSPINPVLVMINRERVLLAMQLIRLVLSVSSALTVGLLTGSAYLVVATFSIATVLAYVGTTIVIVFLCGRADTANRES